MVETSTSDHRFPTLVDPGRIFDFEQVALRCSVVMPTPPSPHPAPTDSVCCIELGACEANSAVVFAWT
eukprot:CAMPEP_0183352664 /NCGR_PEP_ID=MMETSP0164_2-20130417/29616_1 /TAXON_ID=221442 /ORGANISM="Coccolithus pelagicus ssp braarudi, Strain PLY182g" /LENGTH=67 /DNA_ID=CAMNT_0025525147 /DNA_START=268 /DNA_END=471 /DNA_ORIENTATION=+